MLEREKGQGRCLGWLRVEQALPASGKAAAEALFAIGANCGRAEENLGVLIHRAAIIAAVAAEKTAFPALCGF